MKISPIKLLANKEVFKALPVMAVAILAGCGGSGGGGNGVGGPAAKPKITGDNVPYAGSVADAQAFGAGSSVGLSVVEAIDPPLTPAIRSPLFNQPARTPVFEPPLNLYMNTSVSGKTLTASYSTDSAGKNIVGKLTVTSDQNIGGSYTFSPGPTFHATGSITGGNIPLTADFTVKLTDSSGANTMDGSISLTKNNTTLKMTQLALNDQLSLSGGSFEVDFPYTDSNTGITAQVQTILSGLSGSPISDINASTASFAAPSVGLSVTGTATLNFVKNTFSFTETDKQSNFIFMALAPDGTLTNKLPDGITQVIQNAGTFDITKLTGSNGGQQGSGGGNGSYAAPVAVAGPSGATSTYVWGAAPDGELAGTSTNSSNGTTALYWSAPNAQPIALPIPSGATNSAAYGMAVYNGTHTVTGYYTFGDGYYHACTWTSTSASGFGSSVPQTLPIDSSIYPNGGQVRGISSNGKYLVGFVYDSSYNEIPVLFTSSRVFALPLNGITGSFDATGVDNNGDVLGSASGFSNPVVWTKVTVNGSSLSTSQQPLLSTNGSNMPATQAVHISSNGVIVGGSNDGAPLIWTAANGFIATAVDSGTYGGGFIYGVSDDGTQLAGDLFNNSTNQYDMSYWSSLTGKITDLSSKIPATTYKGLAGFYILSDGSFIDLAIDPNTTKPVFVYIKKS